MSRAVLLDAGPLGVGDEPEAVSQWLQSMLAAGARVIIPEIADYEVRRELLRANKARGVAQLDALAAVLEYLPLTTAAMRRAAEFWAQARRRGQPTAGDQTIDGDMILAGQAAAPWRPGDRCHDQRGPPLPLRPGRRLAQCEGVAPNRETSFGWHCPSRRGSLARPGGRGCVVPSRGAAVILSSRARPA